MCPSLPYIFLMPLLLTGLSAAWIGTVPLRAMSVNFRV